MKYRINGFDQIKCFYSIVFEQTYDIKPQHISLYNFLINQNNRNNWVEWFKCPYDLAMAGACIGSKKTYYKCLNDLQEWGFIKYQKGVNDWKAPKIKIEVIKCTSSVTSNVPQSEPLHEQLDEQLDEQLSKQLPIHKYKLLTKNIKHITDNIESVISFVFADVDSLIKQLNNKQLNNKQVNQLKNIISENDSPKKETVYSKDVLFVYDSVINLFDPKNVNEKKYKETIRLLIEVDNYDKNLIIETIKKAKKDEFWSSQFLSLNKLRNKNKDGVKYIEVFKAKFYNTKEIKKGYSVTDSLWQG